MNTLKKYISFLKDPKVLASDKADSIIIVGAILTMITLAIVELIN